MKSRIQSVDDLKRIASKKLEEEFNARYQEAILQGAVQGMAFVMYALEIGEHWKETRQKRLFSHMLSLTQMIEMAPWLQPFNAGDIKKHIEEDYGINFSDLLETLATVPPDSAT